MRPILRTKRLVLAPFTAAMVENWHVAWLNDPEVVKYSEQRHRTHTIESQHTYLNEFRGGYIWLIRRWSLDDAMIEDAIRRGLLESSCMPPYRDLGTITAYLDSLNLTANLGVLIGEKSAWGQGYGLEAWMAVMRWCGEIGMKKVEAGCRGDNLPMQNLAATAGMSLEAVIPSHFQIDEDDRESMMLYGVVL